MFCLSIIRLSKKSPLSDFIWRGTSRDFVARLADSRPKKLAVIRFRGSFHRFFTNFVISVAIFLDCSRGPCRSLLISKLNLCKTRLSSCFVLESRRKTDLLYFFGGIHFQNPGKNSEPNTYRPRFLSNCVISLVQQWLMRGLVNDQLN